MQLRSGARTGKKAKQAKKAQKATQRNKNSQSGAKRSAAAKDEQPEQRKKLTPEEREAIAQHNASSPLLQLPQEIRNLIYDFVVESHVLHMISEQCLNPETRATRIRYKNIICYAHLPGEQEGRMAKWGDDTDITEYHDHVVCYDSRFYVHTWWEKPWRYSYPSLCLSCRQIYAETGLLAFRNHTFCFEGVGHFQTWMETLTAAQAACLRSVHLQVFNCVFFSPNENTLLQWEKSIQHMLSRLRGVSRIELDLVELSTTSCDDDVVGGLMRIVQLPLGSATITMRRNQETLASIIGTKDVAPIVLKGSGERANLSWLRGYLVSVVKKFTAARRY